MVNHLKKHGTFKSSDSPTLTVLYLASAFLTNDSAEKKPRVKKTRTPEAQLNKMPGSLSGPDAGDEVSKRYQILRFPDEPKTHSQDHTLQFSRHSRYSVSWCSPNAHGLAMSDTALPESTRGDFSTQSQCQQVMFTLLNNTFTYVSASPHFYGSVL